MRVVFYFDDDDTRVVQLPPGAPVPAALWGPFPDVRDIRLDLSAKRARVRWTCALDATIGFDVME